MRMNPSQQLKHLLLLLLLLLLMLLLLLLLHAGTSHEQVHALTVLVLTNASLEPAPLLATTLIV